MVDESTIPVMNGEGFIKYLGLRDGKQFINNNISYLRILLDDSIKKVRKLIAAGLNGTQVIDTYNTFLCYLILYPL